VLEDSTSPDGASNANGVVITTAQLADISELLNVIDDNESAYQAAISAETDFSNPPSVSEVQVLIDTVNAVISANDEALAEVLEDSASSGGANNTNGTIVTAAQLADIIGLSNVDPDDESAYQTAILAETDFSNPPELAEVQALIDSVNATINANDSALAEVLEDSSSVGGENNANGLPITSLVICRRLPKYKR